MISLLCFRRSRSIKSKLICVLGIALEALCDPKSTEPESSTLACLASVQALLHSAKARTLIATQPSLSVEVCNVLHRVILTKDATRQQLALTVLQILVQSAQEQLQRLNDPAAGEGGVEGELLPGTSLVFAALEVCLCLLAKCYPSIDPSTNSQSGSRCVLSFICSMRCIFGNSRFFNKDMGLKKNVQKGRPHQRS